jgi:hypothetical protein
MSTHRYTYQYIRKKAQEFLEQKCPYAHLKDEAELKAIDGRVTIPQDSIYCKIIRKRETVYSADESGNISGILVGMEEMKEQPCMYIDNFSSCLLKNVWKL